MIECLIFSELPQKGFLLEASFSLEDRYVARGQNYAYTYAIQQRHKYIEETAYRDIVIPNDKSLKGGNFKLYSWIHKWGKDSLKILVSEPNACSLLLYMDSLTEIFIFPFRSAPF